MDFRDAGMIEIEVIIRAAAHAHALTAGYKLKRDFAGAFRLRHPRGHGNAAECSLGMRLVAVGT